MIEHILQGIKRAGGKADVDLPKFDIKGCDERLAAHICINALEVFLEAINATIGFDMTSEDFHDLHVGVEVEAVRRVLFKASMNSEEVLEAASKLQVSAVNDKLHHKVPNDRLTILDLCKSCLCVKVLYDENPLLLSSSLVRRLLWADRLKLTRMDIVIQGEYDGYA